MSDKERYLAACHAMQSGVAQRMHQDSGETAPKHLRVGVNSAMVQSSVLAQLLMDKGIITEQEWFSALADAMERERDSYAKLISEHLGGITVTLI